MCQDGRNNEASTSQDFNGEFGIYFSAYKLHLLNHQSLPESSIDTLLSLPFFSDASHIVSLESTAQRVLLTSLAIGNDRAGSITFLWAVFRATRQVTSTTGTLNYILGGLHISRSLRPSSNIGDGVTVGPTQIFGYATSRQAILSTSPAE